MAMQAQQDVHSMMYHLYSFTREGTAYSLSPWVLKWTWGIMVTHSGIQSWDVPAILVLHPEMAKSLIEYRYQRLEAARPGAFFRMDIKGAMFPVESAETGVEETPVWALSGPFEHHITADVGMAAWNYYCVTQDKAWLQTRGWPLLQATGADFWASRGEKWSRVIMI